MKQLALALAAAALLLPGAARSAACSPLDCAPSQFTLAGGTLLGFRPAPNKPVSIVDLKTGKTRWVLPAGVTGGRMLVSQSARTLAWYDTATGERVATALLPDLEYTLGAVSQDGTRGVALRFVRGGTRIAVVSSTSLQVVTVKGVQWSVDALSGDNLFLIHNFPRGGYEVRLLHVGSGRLEPKPLKDPHESGRIWGQPFSRLASADGTYLFTLYIGSNGGAMIHELDVRTAKARCIDLPGTGDYGSAASWALVMSHDGGTLWGVSPGYGRVVGIDVVTRKVRTAFRLAIPKWTLGTATSAALAPDGKRVALAEGKNIAVVDLAARTIASHGNVHALALGYSPDQTRLWVVGERSRVTALPVS